MFWVYILLLVCSAYGNEEITGNKVGDSSVGAAQGTLKAPEIALCKQNI
jgi:hypothetical protein